MVSVEGHDQFELKDLMQALKKMKAEKTSMVVVTLASPFNRAVKKSPLPKFYRTNNDLKFDGNSDPEEYLSRFNTEIEVYQVDEPTRCQLLVATLIGNAHQWFK